MATATESKKAKALVTTKITSNGVEISLAKSVENQLGRAYDLCLALKSVPQVKDEARAAADSISCLLAAVANPKAETDDDE